MLNCKSLLSFLEHPSHPSVGPHLRFIGLTGLWHPKPHTRNTKIKRCLLYITVSFFFSQYIKCIKNFDVGSFKQLLQYAPFHMGIIKTCFFQMQHSKWEKLINYMSLQECNQLRSVNKGYGVIIKDYIKRSRRMTYFFWTLAVFSNFFIFSEPYQKNETSGNGTNVYLYMFDGFTPFEREPPGYYMTVALQTILGNIVSAYIVGWDTLVVTIMIFFAGQLQISRLNCANVIEENSKRSQENIVACHGFHVKLIRYQKLFNSLISPVMFLYLIGISVNLGVSIIQIADSENDMATRISGFVFVFACLIQLLLFYWFSNAVIVESGLVSYGTFESEWFKTNKVLQKEVAILALTTNKRMVFRAGPFNEMSLSTFVAILKTSYSFYTLLNGTK